MEMVMDPSVWMGLFTLIILEIILGIDNLVFIIILSDKLPKKERHHARIIGLVLALVLRITLLSFIYWIVTLTRPLLCIGVFSFSGRDLILLFGGIFLLFKATIELHERVENKVVCENSAHGNNNFWIVVIQIVIFDAIFSLDAIITAVGMVSHLIIMMIAIVIAAIIMALTFRSLSSFINDHQTVVVLCLSFLLMIGLSLISEGIGFHIPKGYLYTAIGFSILIEFFNQLAHFNYIKHQQSIKSMRERTADAIIRLMRGQIRYNYQEENNISSKFSKKVHFAEEERDMISGVLSLASRTLRSIMTPRNEISWLDCNRPVKELYSKLMDTPHNMFPVCNEELDQLIGVVRAKDLMEVIANGDQISVYASENLATVVPETLDVLNLLGELRRAKGSMVMVSNEFGVIQGLVTPVDVLEAIAGEFPDEDETPEIEITAEGWRVKGSTDLHALQQALHTQDLVNGYDNNVVSLAGLLLSQCDYIPVEGDVIMINTWEFTIQKMSKYRIELVNIRCLFSNNENEK